MSLWSEDRCCISYLSMWVQFLHRTAVWRTIRRLWNEQAHLDLPVTSRWLQVPSSSFAVHVPHPRWITTVLMMNRTTMSSDMDVTRKKNGGFTEMDNYMREFIVGLKKEGKELKTLLPVCNGERSNRLWKRLTEWRVCFTVFIREVLVFPNKQYGIGIPERNRWREGRYMKNTVYITPVIRSVSTEKTQNQMD